jgi:hypothetical protein
MAFKMLKSILVMAFAVNQLRRFDISWLSAAFFTVSKG